MRDIVLPPMPAKQGEATRAAAKARKRKRTPPKGHRRCQRCRTEQSIEEFAELEVPVARGRDRAPDYRDSFCLTCRVDMTKPNPTMSSDREDEVRARMGDLRLTAEEESAIRLALSRWGSSAPSPDDTLSAFYGCDDWQRARPGLATVITLLARG
jgi:hypothetical protein